MTEEEKLIALKAMVGGSDSDEVLSTYLKLAGRKIINRAYPYDSSVTEVPAQYDTTRIGSSVEFHLGCRWYRRSFRFFVQTQKCS